MDYNIGGIILTDPIITVRSMNVLYDEDVERAFVDVLLVCSVNPENDAPIVLEDDIIPIPSTTKINAIKAWVGKKLKEFEIQRNGDNADGHINAAKLKINTNEH